MKPINFLLILFLFTLVSCDLHYSNEGTLSKSDLDKAQDICKTNGGVEKIHSIKKSFKAVCVNQAVFVQKHTEGKKQYSASETNPVVLDSDIAKCKSLCEQNTGVKEMTTNRFCSKDRVYIKSVVCLETSDTVTCACNNGIEKVETRVNLSSSEKTN